MNGTENKSHSPIAQDVTVNYNGRELAKSRLKRWLYAVGGSLALLLAVLGIFVPGLPCTPLALLSAALFAKSSDRLYNWLLNTKVIGPRIKNYQKQKGVSKSGKIKILLLMWSMVLFSSLIIVNPLSLKIIIISGGMVGTIVVWFFVPFAKDACEGEDS